MADGADSLPFRMAVLACKTASCRFQRCRKGLGRFLCKPHKPAEPPGRQRRLGAKPKGAKLLKAERLGHGPNKPAETPGRRKEARGEPEGSEAPEGRAFGRWAQ